MFMQKNHTLSSRIFAVMLALALSISTLAMQAFAADYQELPTPSPSTYSSSFKNQLTTVEKQIYDALVSSKAMLKDGGGTVTVTFTDLKVTAADSDAATALVGEAVARAMDAYLLDTPYAQNSGFSLGMSYGDLGDGSFMIASVTLVVSGHTTTSEEKALIAKLYAAASSQPDDYSKVKAIHDTLAANVSYDQSAVDSPGSKPAAHQIQGAASGKAVCEGYAKAFKAACDAVGIPCVLQAGTLSAGALAGPHMWNMVQMDDGEWYAVDVTNDDQNSGIKTTMLLMGSDSNLSAILGAGSTFASAYSGQEDNVQISGYSVGFYWPDVAAGSYVPSGDPGPGPGPVDGKYTVNIVIGEGASISVGSYYVVDGASVEAGKSIYASVVVATGYTFDHWEVSPAMAFVDNDNTKTTCSIVMPANNVTLTAHITKNAADPGTDPTPETGTPIKGSGSGGGGGGGGGSSRTTSTATTTVAAAPLNTPVDVTLTQAQSSATAAATAAKTAGAASASIRFVNPNSLTLAVAQGMVKSAGMPAHINADSMNAANTVVDVRITLDPAKVTADVNVSASISSAHSVSVRDFFAKWFQNTVTVISLGQKGAFGQSVQVAAKIDPLLGQNPLYFYSYDSATNSYVQIAKPAHWFDTSGYVHFNTELGGDIVITNAPLKLK